MLVRCLVIPRLQHVRSLTPRAPAAVSRTDRRLTCTEKLPRGIFKEYKSESGAHEAANKYIPKHPSFKSLMGKASVMKGLLFIPASFCKRYMHRQKRGTIVKLQHSGRLWPVKLCINEKREASFSAGWRRFVNENSIKFGDVCVFELIWANDLEMKVSIFRSR